MSDKSTSKAIIWDWNGTLLDDLDICIIGINKYLTERNLKTLDKKKYRNIFGFPIGDYYQKIGFDLKKESLEDLSVKFLKTYFENFNQTKLNNGAYKTLIRFHEAGYQQFILSALDQPSLDDSIKIFKIENFFKAIKGAQDTLAKGKIDYGRELFAAENLHPDNTILIGDTLHDKEVADSLKIKCVLYSGGHQTYDRLAINNSIVVSDLLKSFDVVEKLL